MLKTSLEAVTLSILGFSSSGTSAIGLASMGGVTESNTLTEQTWIPLGLFLAGIAMTATVVWKVASHKTNTDAKLLDLQKRIKRLEKEK